MLLISHDELIRGNAEKRKKGKTGGKLESGGKNVKTQSPSFSYSSRKESSRVETFLIAL